MKIYRYDGKGHYIGSTIAVTAESLEEAETHIRKLLDDGGLPDEEMDISETELINGLVIVNDNGDY